MKKNILHITPHLGGGVGNVVRGYIKSDKFFNHKIICLDYANEESKIFAQNFNIQLYGDYYKNISRILKLIEQADVVLIHFWNHPLLYDFIIRNELPLSRVVFWSHTSGTCPPHNFTNQILNYPDKFVFNTYLAFENPEVSSLSAIQKNDIKVIWATGGVEHLKNISRKKKDTFNVGYIGTVDYCRLHRNFLDMCAKVKIDNVKFIVCGGLKESEIRQEAQEMGIVDKFEFLGKVNNVEGYLANFDVFAYPLVFNHSGTCDLVLQEAMAAGVVPVVFDNLMEKTMVIDGETGLVAKTEEEYVQAIEKLYRDVDLRNKLSVQAKNYALEKFSLQALVNDWKSVFDEVILLPKTIKKWTCAKNTTKIEYKDVFLEALGDYAIPFQKFLDSESREEGESMIKELAKMQTWKGDSKSTVHQYQKFFQEDEMLKEWSRIMNNEQ